MKIFLFIFLVVIVVNQSKHQQNLTKFEKTYKSCSDNQCKERQNDEACIFICMNRACFEQVYENYLLEYGEVNTELKNKFEKCFNANK
jgi:hypothetical protein